MRGTITFIVSTNINAGLEDKDPSIYLYPDSY